MTTDPFVHLHVASGYSLRHGASHPEALVARAAELGMDALALTDRDGVHGAVKFAKAGLVHGRRPILGVDLAVLPDLVLPDGRGRAPAVPSAPAAARRSPVRRARGARSTSGTRGSRCWPGPVGSRSSPAPGGRTGAGWAALNRLVSATHLGTGEAPASAAGR